MDSAFHYPPELLNLLVDTIPLLNRSKRDVFLFFEGAGVPKPLMSEPWERWKQDKDAIGKHEISRQILIKLNSVGDKHLRERREVLKRIVETESFDTCWPNDQLKAKGLVSEIRKVIDVKDSFTKMNQERQAEVNKRSASARAERDAIAKRDQELEKLREDLGALFAETNARKRGLALESVLNDLFQVVGIRIRESFCLRGDEEEGIIEQVDGVIEIGGQLYLVEIKWWKDPIGVSEISQHMMRIFLRADCRAIILSANGFTKPAITECKKALSQKTVVLCELEEIVRWLENKADLVANLERKVHAAMIEGEPHFKIID